MKKLAQFLFSFSLIANLQLVSAKVVEVQLNEGFLRTKLFSQKELITISKINNVLSIKTLNSEVFGEIKADSALFTNNEYVESVKEIEPVDGNTFFTLEVILKKNVEIFSFYKSRELAYFIDFWKDGGAVKETASSVRPADIANTEVKKEEIKIVKAPVKKVIRVQAPAPVVVQKPKEFRDFRYGASFIWNYEPVMPKIEKTFHLERKTPQYFYPVADREFDKSEKEAHLQLSINLFRKKKWGLMTKSIKLYEEKYKIDENNTFNEYLKANALLMDSTENGDIKPVDTAIAMFINIVEKSPVYEMRRAINKYMIQYYFEKNDNLSILRFSKRFFSDAKENFDYEELEYATEIMLLALSNLNQIDDIQKLISEKTIQKILPIQKRVAYELYTLLKLGNLDQVVKKYEEFAKSTRGEVLPSIMYNAAETYFRLAEYDKAIKLYDDYLEAHSYHSQSSQARLRIALASDLLNKDEKTVAELYKNAINRSQNVEVSTEARIRYVGLRSLRKINPESDDAEVRVFLDKGTDKKLSKDLEKLLWLARVRTFIVDKKYEDGLSFLTALPMSSMDKSEKVVFEGDGAEIIYGIIKDNFNLGEFARSIRAWEIYKDIYFEKVATDPEIQFIVAKSYANLGLWNGFEKVYAQIIADKATKSRTYPIWIERSSNVTSTALEKELQIVRNLKLENWASVEKIVDEIVAEDAKYPKTDFYRGLAQYRQKKYSQAESVYERFFSQNINFSYIDGKDLVDSIVNYLESIYAQSKYDKFIEVSDALVKDASNFKVDKKVVDNMRERISYLRVEILNSKSDKRSFAESESFLKNYTQSTYSSRVKFLLGRENVRANNLVDGEKILTELINSDKVEGYIKEMARAELTMLNLKKRTL